MIIPGDVVGVLTIIIVAAISGWIGIQKHRERNRQQRLARRPNYEHIERMEAELFPDDQEDR